MAGASGIPGQASEIWSLLVAYIKQETLDPVRGMGRFIAFGIAGAVFVGIGSVMLVLAALRAAQTETGSTFDGNFSFVPYLIAMVVAFVIVGLAVRAVGKERRHSEQRRQAR